MSNVTLPWNHPSNSKLGIPTEYRALEQDLSVNVRGSKFGQMEYCSPQLSRVNNASNVQATSPEE
jgi:hypothetical protein